MEKEEYGLKGHVETYMLKNGIDLGMYKIHEIYHTHELGTGVCECGMEILGIRFDESGSKLNRRICLEHVLFVSSYIFRSTAEDVLLENFLLKHKNVLLWIVQLLRTADSTNDHFLISNARKSLEYLQKLIGEEFDEYAGF